MIFRGEDVGVGVGVGVSWGSEEVVEEEDDKEEEEEDDEEGDDKEEWEEICGEDKEHEDDIICKLKNSETKKFFISKTEALFSPKKVAKKSFFIFPNFLSDGCFFNEKKINFSWLLLFSFSFLLYSSIFWIELIMIFSPKNKNSFFCFIRSTWEFSSFKFPFSWW